MMQNDKCREEVLSAGGLHSLVHCMTTASSQGWPQVEYQSAKAIVRLVPAVKNLAHLVKYSQVPPTACGCTGLGGLRVLTSHIHSHSVCTA